MDNAAGGVTPAAPSSFASLERTLERTVDTLVKGEPSAEAKALLIEARRLRSIVANWRSIPPPTDVYDEMLERVLHLSTAAGAALYDPGPSSVRSELEPRRPPSREPPLYDEFEQTERTEIDPSSSVDFEQTERRDFEPPSRRNFEPAERRDLEPPSRRNFEQAERRDLEPPSRRNFEPVERRDLEPPSRRNFAPPSFGGREDAFPTAEVPAEDDERTIQESPYYPPVHGATSGRRASAGTTGRRSPESAPSFAAEDEEPTSSRAPGSVRSADFAQARPGRPLMATTGSRPAEPLRTGSGMSPRGRALGTRSGMPAFSSSHSLEDPPEYPAFDSPAYGDDAPSYPSYDLNAAARQQLASNAAARADAAAAAARAATLAPQAQPTLAPAPIPTRVPSPMPARAQSSPVLLRSAFPDALPDALPRSRFPSEGLGFDGEAAPEEAPIAPATSVNVQPAQIAEKVDPNIVLLSDAHSDRADAYRALRRKLASSGNPQVIAVTSSDAGEGKTTCTLNLALAMRETSHGKVLVIEANGHSPAIARLLGIETPECFYDQLESRREDPRRPWVAVEVMPKLHLMTVDPTIKRAPQLEPLAFAHGMQRLKLAGYEYILLDTPPVLGTFEVNLIADNVAGVLFTAITMKSKRSHLRKAIEQIMPATVLGVMVLDQ